MSTPLDPQAQSDAGKAYNARAEQYRQVRDGQNAFDSEIGRLSRDHMARVAAIDAKFMAKSSSRTFWLMFAYGWAMYIVGFCVARFL